MGIPKSANSDIFHNWAQLPISREQFARELKEIMRQGVLNCKPLPDAETILSDLSRARVTSSWKLVELALVSITTSETYKLKTSNPETIHLLSFIQPEKHVLGDDPGIGMGRRKPALDMYLTALDVLNSVANLGAGEKLILPEECLVFEDSIIGVEAGRRAGMRVVWVPHLDLATEYQPFEKEVLAGKTGIVDIGDQRQLGQIDNGWAERIATLEHFDFEKYGFDVRL